MAERQGRLIVVCGLPGSGKTTVAAELAARHDGIRYDPDEWMDAISINLWDSDRRAAIEKLQWQQARHVLALGGTAIIEWGTWARVERDGLRTEARGLGAAVELVYLRTEPDILFDRISRRGRENPPITRGMVEAWFAAFEAPTPEEFALFDPPSEDPPT